MRPRGVEFTEPPERRPYGLDASLRDPSGNNIRLAQVELDETAVVAVG